LIYIWINIRTQLASYLHKKYYYLISRNNYF